MDFEELDYLSQINSMMDEPSKSTTADAINKQYDTFVTQYQPDKIGFKTVAVVGVTIHDTVTDSINQAVTNKRLLKHCVKMGRFIRRTKKGD